MSLRCCRIQRRAITLRINKHRPEGPTQATESQMERPQALPISKIVNHKSTNDCQCSRIDVEPRILSCRSAGAPEIRLGLIPGRTQPRWGWDIRNTELPRVGSVPLRQPRAEIRIPVGDEEPSPPSSKIILPTTFSYARNQNCGNGWETGKEIPAFLHSLLDPLRLRILRRDSRGMGECSFNEEGRKAGRQESRKESEGVTETVSPLGMKNLRHPVRKSSCPPLSVPRLSS